MAQHSERRVNRPCDTHAAARSEDDAPRETLPFRIVVNGVKLPPPVDLDSLAECDDPDGWEGG